MSTILSLHPPTNVKQLRQVLGIIQFYQDIWEKRAYLHAPITNLVGKCITTKYTQKMGQTRPLTLG